MANFIDYTNTYPGAVFWQNTDGYVTLTGTSATLTNKRATVPLVNATYDLPRKPEDIITPMGELFALYGTMRQGHRNHHLLIEEKAKYIALGIAEDFSLIEVCPGVPGAISDASTKNGEIYAELWQLQQPNIKILEAIETEYTKGVAKVRTNSGIVYASIWIWQNPYEDSQRIRIRDWDLDTERSSLEFSLSPKYKASK